MLKKNNDIMGQAVLHFEKHQKPTSGSLGNHIDRTEGKEYSYRHADLSKLEYGKSITAIL